MRHLLQSVIASFAFFSSSMPAQSISVMNVESSLEIIRLWLREYAAPLDEQLSPPASPDEIDAFEAQSGIILPSSVRAAYSVHNGEKRSSQGIFGSWRWLPLDEVTSNRQQLLESGMSLAAEAIPILVSGGGDYYFAESVAAVSGESEIMEWWHEQPTRDVQHETFAAFLGNFAALLEQGQYVYLPNELVGLINRDDL